MLLISKNLIQLELVLKLLDCQKDLFPRIIEKSDRFRFKQKCQVRQEKGFTSYFFNFEQNKDVNVEIEAIAVIGPFKEA